MKNSPNPSAEVLPPPAANGLTGSGSSDVVVQPVGGRGLGRGLGRGVENVVAGLGLVHGCGLGRVANRDGNRRPADG